MFCAGNTFDSILRATCTRRHQLAPQLAVEKRSSSTRALTHVPTRGATHEQVLNGDGP